MRGVAYLKPLAEPFHLETLGQNAQLLQNRSIPWVVLGEPVGGSEELLDVSAPGEVEQYRSV